MSDDRNACPVTVAFGLRVRELRAEREWAARYLAEVTGLGLTGLYRLEKGDNTTLATAAKIAEAFGMPLASMLDPGGCANCHGAPRRGFTCQECGTAGAGLAGLEPVSLRFAESGLPPVPDREAGR